MKILISLLYIFSYELSHSVSFRLESFTTIVPTITTIAVVNISRTCSCLMQFDYFKKYIYLVQ